MLQESALQNWGHALAEILRVIGPKAPNLYVMTQGILQSFDFKLATPAIFQN